MGNENSATVYNTDLTEAELFEKYINGRDVNVRNEIVQRYIYLAEILSKKFLHRGLEYDDIYQVACVALIKAVERFDPKKGVKFVSFATPTIVGEIKRYFRDKGSIIRIPRRIYESYQRVGQARETLYHKLHRAPRVDEIAEYLNISEEMVLEIVESSNAHNMQSFDQAIFADEDIELHETIGENDTSFDKIENRDFIMKSMERFNETEKIFIEMRYAKGRTQKQIADKLGVSQMYVSRLEKKVVERFRTILEKQ
jgi:RNA polymerase sigma-B factor